MKKLLFLCVVLPLLAVAGEVTATGVAFCAATMHLSLDTSTPITDVVESGGSFGYAPPGSATSYLIPHDWFIMTGLAMEGETTVGLDVKLAAVYANGHTGWESYVAGLRPNDAASELQALVELRDGKVCISWTPDLNSNGVTRIYTVFGRTDLDKGDWETPAQPWHRFFKVAVSMLTGAADENTAVAGEGFVPEEKPLSGVQLWKNGPYWAECNVGATKPEEHGYYFWWGDTVGYSANTNNATWSTSESYWNGVKWVSSKGVQVSSSLFITSTCPTYNKMAVQLLSAGYIDSTNNLVYAHDAATAHLGVPWRMPTDVEISALCNNCTTTWEQQNGVWGRRVTGKGAYSSKSIFLPAAGWGFDSGLNYLGQQGEYWSSTSYPNSPNSAYVLHFEFKGSHIIWLSFHYRNFGHPVRPVR